MRTRLFVISSLAIAAVAGGASMNAAVAGPYQGPGDISDKPTTTTTQKPKGPDKVAPNPTTTTVPPKGPDDIAPNPPKGDEPKPEGPQEKAPLPPKGDGGDKPGPDTTGNGSGSDNDVPPAGGAADNGVGSNVGGVSVDAETATDSTEEAAAEQADAGGVSPLVIILAAAVVGGLIAFAATRLRRDDEDAERI